MAKCYAADNDAGDDDADVSWHLVDNKRAIWLKQDWDETCRAQKRNYELEKASGWTTGAEEGKKWAGEALFDSSVKIREWEAEGWFERYRLQLSRQAIRRGVLLDGADGCC